MVGRLVWGRLGLVGHFGRWGRSREDGVETVLGFRCMVICRLFVGCFWFFVCRLRFFVCRFRFLVCRLGLFVTRFRFFVSGFRFFIGWLRFFVGWLGLFVGWLRFFVGWFRFLCRFNVTNGGWFMNRVVVGSCRSMNTCGMGMIAASGHRICHSMVGCIGVGVDIAKGWWGMDRVVGR